MKTIDKPNWWPECPYPKDIFTMQPNEYPRIVPDEKTRTALSGLLGREFWNIASEMIAERYQEAIEDGRITELPPQAKNENILKRGTLQNGSITRGCER